MLSQISNVLLVCITGGLLCENDFLTKASLLSAAAILIARKVFTAGGKNYRKCLAPNRQSAEATARKALGLTLTGKEADNTSVEQIVAGQPGKLDLRRKCQIAFAKTTDHSGEVVVVEQQGFSLAKTIFRNVPGLLARTVLKSKVGIDLYWSDDATERITLGFSLVPRAPKHEQPLIDFMNTDCNFAMEHADGHFMDHLRFCYEYCAVHYKAVSARVLFLHSILGVGTNFFPMSADKIPKLQTIVTPTEFIQLESFPSILRLLITHDFLAELRARGTKGLQSVTFYRVIDNKELTLVREDLWVALNYQLIHILDFIPVSNWLALQDDLYLQVLGPLFNFLKAEGQLRANIDVDLTDGDSTRNGMPFTLGHFLAMTASRVGVTKKMSVKVMKKYSAAIGHSLKYKLNYAQ